MVFMPMALAARMRCTQCSRGMFCGCISAPRIWKGLPSSMNSRFISPPKAKVAGFPCGSCMFDTASTPAVARGAATSIIVAIIDFMTRGA